ncbi:hypothetical protein Bealeia1_01033 [Candidatus Bealeia paramacronuclearis]|uniref:Uncharacterized protein n=2 Tax=Candidatus Bealeia paramacronuclearis TaxID=1921001 RepID=A0ABZ2C534_9PROT|nr:hypothetical protein [Candidatus Bealeia paramacronuclearis]
MKNPIISSFLILSTVSLLSALNLSANNHKIAVNNLSTDVVDIYVRGEGKNSPTQPHATVLGKTKKEFSQSHPDAFIEVVAISQGSQPDWNPTGGACKHLLSTTDHTIVVEDTAMGLKFRCETVN